MSTDKATTDLFNLKPGDGSTEIHGWMIWNQQFWPQQFRLPKAQDGNPKLTTHPRNCSACKWQLPRRGNAEKCWDGHWGTKRTNFVWTWNMSHCQSAGTTSFNNKNNIYIITVVYIHGTVSFSPKFQKDSSLGCVVFHAVDLASLLLKTIFQKYAKLSVGIISFCLLLLHIHPFAKRPRDAEHLWLWPTSTDLRRGKGWRITFSRWTQLPTCLQLVQTWNNYRL